MNKTVNSILRLVNYVHSRLNPTIVKKRVAVKSCQEIIDLIQNAQLSGERICIARGRHAMGGQQFLTSGLLIDTTEMKNILYFDYERGLIEVEGGILWTDLIFYLQKEQQGKAHQWTIAQKQTGGEKLKIGGSISANGHGRGIFHATPSADVESFELILGDGTGCVMQSQRE